MAMKTGFGKKYKRRPGQGHQAVTNLAILRALAGNSSAARVARSLDVPEALVRRLAKRYAAGGGSSPTGAGGAGIRTGGSRKAGSTMVIAGIAPPNLIRTAVPAVTPSTVVDPGDMEHQVRARLVRHLGSENAADVWLNSTRTGYPTTALDVIRAGKGGLVLDDLENRWGPGPSYG